MSQKDRGKGSTGASAGGRAEPGAEASSGAGVQGWLFDRPPQDAECTSMKPPRRLGKGLADMVGLHGGTIVTSADDDGDAATGPAVPDSVLHLLSTEAEGLPGPLVVKDTAQRVAPAAAVVREPVVEQPVAAEPPAEVVETPVVEAPVHEQSVEQAVEQMGEQMGDVPTPVAEVIEAPVHIPVEPVREHVQERVAEPAPVMEAPTPEPVPEPQRAAPVEEVSEGFADEWFDPPIASFSPAGGFHRVEAAAPAPEVAPPPAEPEPVTYERAPPSRIEQHLEPLPEPTREPERAPERRPEPEPAPVLDDPVLVDDGLFFDDVVVGSFLPEIDLDS